MQRMKRGDGQRIFACRYLSIFAGRYLTLFEAREVPASFVALLRLGLGAL